MIRKPISNTRYAILSISGIFMLIAAYSVLCYKQKQFNPSDTSIPDAYQFIEAIKNLGYPLLADLEHTYFRHACGMLVGIVLSLIVGILMGCFYSVEAVFQLPLSGLAKVPPTAMIAVYFVLFGTDLQMYVAMISLGIFPTLAFSVYSSVRKDVTEHAIHKAYTLGASHCEVIWNVIFKQILPRFLEAIRLTTGPAMIFLIAAEWNLADVGIGYRLKINSRLMDMSVVYIYLMILAFTSYLMDHTITMLRQKLCPWYGD